MVPLRDWDRLRTGLGRKRVVARITARSVGRYVKLTIADASGEAELVLDHDPGLPTNWCVVCPWNRTNSRCNLLPVRTIIVLDHDYGSLIIVFCVVQWPARSPLFFFFGQNNNRARTRFWSINRLMGSLLLEEKILKQQRINTHKIPKASGSRLWRSSLWSPPPTKAVWWPRKRVKNKHKGKNDPRTEE